MKKAVLILLSLLTVFVFAGCGSDKKDGVDIEYYANLGQIPEASYALDFNAKTAVKDLEAKQESDEDFYFDNFEDGDKGTVIASDTKYFYSVKTNKINRVVTFSTAYGYKTGTVSIEIKKALKEKDLKLKERSLTGDESALLSASSDTDAIEVDFEKATVLFAFENNSLFATVLTKK